MSDINPRAIETLPVSDHRVVEVGNFDKAVVVSSGHGKVESALTPTAARELASILRWQADMAEQGPPPRWTVNVSEVDPAQAEAFAEEIRRAREAQP